MLDKWEHGQYDDAFEAIQLMARAKMVMNYHKGDIANLEFVHLVTAAIDEIAELNGAILDGNHMHAVEEAADALNYLVAIVQKSINNYRGRKNVKNTGHTESTGHEEVDNCEDCGVSIRSGAHFQRCNDCARSFIPPGIPGRDSDKSSTGARSGRSVDGGHPIESKDEDAGTGQVDETGSDQERAESPKSKPDGGYHC